MVVIMLKSFYKKLDFMITKPMKSFQMEDHSRKIESMTNQWWKTQHLYQKVLKYELIKKRGYSLNNIFFYNFNNTFIEKKVLVISFIHINW